MVRGGGGLDATTPRRFYQFFSGIGRAFLQTKVLAVGSSLGHLPIKNFQIGPTVLALKLDKGRVLGVRQPQPMPPSPPPTAHKLTQFSNHEDDIQP